MPFDDEYGEDIHSEQSQKSGLKKISSQASIFDDLPKRQSKEDFDKKVRQVQEKDSGYKVKAAELADKFRKTMNDKTLSANKNVFAKEMEKELLTDMVQLAIDINNDSKELEGMGSLSWITLLLKTCFSQRDKINSLEYLIFSLDKKVDSFQALDKKKNSE
jgi:hypothetical protein